MGASPAGTGRVLITTPIYYVNDRPHLGHAYTTVAADFMSRAHRLLGREVFFLTGTDEHGERIAEIARARGRTPIAHCDEMVMAFQNAWKSLHIEYSRFIRTTEDEHVRGVEKMLTLLRAAIGPDGRPVVYESEYRGLYCPGCEKFLNSREIVDDRCPVHPTLELREISERNHFFRLSAFLGRLKDLIDRDEILIRPEMRKNEVLGLFAQGLDDFSISREKVTWGIPLPFDPAQTAYVWVDALSNYITAIGFGDRPQEFAKWWRDGSVLHLMAKDILKFHAVYWPAMLLAVGEKPPDELFIHGYLTLVGQKMSKSLANVIKPDAWAADFGVDGARYLLLTLFRFGQDGEVKEDLLREKYNADLANDFGNLVSRAAKLIEQHCGGRIPETDFSGADEQALRQRIDDAQRSFAEAIDAVDPNAAIEAALGLVRQTNRYFDHAAPWQLAKEKHAVRLHVVLGASIAAVGAAAALLSPILPTKSPQVLRILGYADEEITQQLKQGHPLASPAGRQVAMTAAVFPRVEKAKPAVAVEKKEQMDTTGVISIDQFLAAKLKTAQIISAERVEGANKLLKLQIRLGEETRQIVAGIAEHYTPEELIGKTIIVVANLQPTKIRGIASDGMLLAANDGKTLRLVTTDGPISPGAAIS